MTGSKNHWKHSKTKDRPIPVEGERFINVSNEGIEEKELLNTASSQEWDRVREFAIKQLDRCLFLEPKVLRGDDSDAIHDLRVATRRLQQVLDLTFPAPRDRQISRLRRRLKRCRRTLSDVRNYDVLLERANAALARKRVAYQEAWRAIRKSLSERRVTSFEKGLHKLSKANIPEFYVRLKERFAEPAGAPANGNEAGQAAEAPNPAVQNLELRLIDNLKNVWVALRNQVEQSCREPSPAGMHLVRIRAKRMRYLLEVIHYLNVPRATEQLVWLRELQRRLGQWHDSLVFEQAVIEMVADRNFLRNHMELALEIEKLVLKNRKKTRKLEERCVAMMSDQVSLAKIENWVDKVAALPSAAFKAA